MHEALGSVLNTGGGDLIGVCKVLNKYTDPQIPQREGIAQASLSLPPYHGPWTPTSLQGGNQSLHNLQRSHFIERETVPAVVHNCENSCLPLTSPRQPLVTAYFCLEHCVCLTFFSQ